MNARTPRARKPLSLHPLDPEQALAAFLQVKPRPGKKKPARKPKRVKKRGK